MLPIQLVEPPEFPAHDEIQLGKSWFMPLAGMGQGIYRGNKTIIVCTKELGGRIVTRVIPDTMMEAIRNVFHDVDCGLAYARSKRCPLNSPG